MMDEDDEVDQDDDTDGVDANSDDDGRGMCESSDSLDEDDSPDWYDYFSLLTTGKIYVKNKRELSQSHCLIIPSDSLFIVQGWNNLILRLQFFLRSVAHTYS